MIRIQQKCVCNVFASCKKSQALYSLALVDSNSAAPTAAKEADTRRNAKFTRGLADSLVLFKENIL